MSAQLISVIIPAYNAAGSIDRTLRSVRHQTWSDIEIIVVDDGSQDATAERVRCHSAEDGRIRLIETPNGGVARARNRAIVEARGEWVAPIDADDLWHSEKLAAQMASAREANDRTGLVYCWSSIIDREDRIISYGDRALDAGDVLRRMCMGNLVGNGSVPLMRRDAILKVGGYDPSLRDAKAQGCEDLKLYLTMSKHYDFAVVPAYLVGYRWTRENMSSDARQMLRSYDLVIDPLYDDYQGYRDVLIRGRIYMLRWLIERSVRYGDLDIARELWVELARMRPAEAARSLYSLTRILARHRWFDKPRILGTVFGSDLMTS